MGHVKSNMQRIAHTKVSGIHCDDVVFPKVKLVSQRHEKSAQSVIQMVTGLPIKIVRLRQIFLKYYKILIFL